MRKFVFASLAALAAITLQLSNATVALASPAHGEVTKVDPTAGKVTLRHGPIKNLDMDSMTMVFRVADPVMLRSIKPGDRVQFEADRVNGQITITNISKLR